MSTDLRRGAQAALPLTLGVVPFAVVSGVAAVGAGLTLTEAMGMSVVVFAGASQLAALDLLSRDAPVTVVVLTAAVINLRMMMYSASIAPHLQSLPSRLKALSAYLLTDQAFALSVARFTAPDRDSLNRPRYYFGVAATLWLVWQAGTVVGVLLGAGVPESWGLTFAVPLVFLAVLVPALKDVPSYVAGAVGGAVAVVAAGLPLNLGLLVGAAAGVTAGVLTEEVRS